MRIDTSEIQDSGAHIGQKLWICHYNRPDINKKPLRCVEPTYVIVRDNAELPIGKQVYYSECHFSPLKDDGRGNHIPKKAVISPVDNTGYRARQGNPLHVFTTYEECVAQWNEDIAQCAEEMRKEQDVAAQRWIDERKAVEKRAIFVI